MLEASATPIPSVRCRCTIWASSLTGASCGRAGAPILMSGRIQHSMRLLRIMAGPFEFRARLETDLAPMTCAAFEALLPFRNKLIQARWSGESAWIPLGDFKVGVSFE